MLNIFKLFGLVWQIIPNKITKVGRIAVRVAQSLCHAEHMRESLLFDQQEHSSRLQQETAHTTSASSHPQIRRNSVWRLVLVIFRRLRKRVRLDSSCVWCSRELRCFENADSSSWDLPERSPHPVDDCTSCRARHGQKNTSTLGCILLMMPTHPPWQGLCYPACGVLEVLKI